MDSFQCSDCGKLPPEAESAYTLIGGKSGWRLSRRRDASGNLVTEWRCAECWAQHRKAPASGPSAPGKVAATRPSTAPAAPRAPLQGRGKA